MIFLSTVDSFPGQLLLVISHDFPCQAVSNHAYKNWCRPLSFYAYHWVGPSNIYTCTVDVKCQYYGVVKVLQLFEHIRALFLIFVSMKKTSSPNCRIAMQNPNSATEHLGMDAILAFTLASTLQIAAASALLNNHYGKRIN